MNDPTSLTWIDKAVMVVTTAALFVLGLFAGLLALAMAGAVLVAAAFKRWRIRHNRQQSNIIDGEYRRIDATDPS